MFVGDMLTIDCGYVYEVADGSHCAIICPGGHAYGQYIPVLHGWSGDIAQPPFCRSDVTGTSPAWVGKAQVPSRFSNILESSFRARDSRNRWRCLYSSTLRLWLCAAVVNGTCSASAAHIAIASKNFIVTLRSDIGQISRLNEENVYTGDHLISK